MRAILLISLLLLGACAPQTQRPTPAQPAQQTPRPEAPPRQQLEPTISQQDLTELTRRLTRRWAKVSAEEKLLIEYTLYTRWLHTDTRPNIAWATDDVTLTPWALLAELTRARDPAALDKVLALYPEALFAHHLADFLKQRAAMPDTIAIFLPLSGRFAAIGEQVRLGILQALFKTDPPVELLFYNSATDAETLKNHYQDALQAGADAIIGPLRPEAIDVISQISHLPTLFLNTSPNRFGQVFPYPTPSEAAQIHARLFKQAYRHIGLLHRETPRAARLASGLQKHWQANTTPESEPYRISARTISARHRDIRRQFDLLMQVSQSKARAHYLKQVLGHRLRFEPRPRQDLQALVILSGREEAAILNPLVAFYELDIPVFGSSLLMPARPGPDPQSRDLAGIQFPAFPALLAAQHGTPLQAWGQDALQLLLTPPGYDQCLAGRSGQLHLTRDKIWDRHLKWLKYQVSGKLTQADTP